MHSTSMAKRKPSWIVPVIVTLLGPHWACSLKSLDYLKSGTEKDGEADDGPTAIGPTSDDGPDPDLTTVGEADLDETMATGDEVGTEIDGLASADGTGPSADDTGGAQVERDGGLAGAGGTVDAGGEVATVGAGGAGGSSVAWDASMGSGGVVSLGDGGQVGSGGVVAGSGGDGSGGLLESGGAPGTGGKGTGGRGTGGSGSGGSADAGAQRSVLFVVGSLALNSGDAAIKSHLERGGFTVTPILDGNVATNPTVAQSVVLISRTIAASKVTNKLRSTPKPLMVFEPEIYGTMGLVDGTEGSYGTTSTSSASVTVSTAAGALAAGRSGAVTIFGSAQQLGYGVPNDQAITVASVPGHDTQWAIFAYDAGGQMPGLTAPARRMGFLFTQTSAQSMNSAGWALFDAALAWLTEPLPSPPGAMKRRR